MCCRRPRNDPPTPVLAPAAHIANTVQRREKDKDSKERVCRDVTMGNESDVGDATVGKRDMRCGESDKRVLL